MVYIIFHNQTDAMHCRNVFLKEQIEGVVVKAPRVRTSDSCAWAVRIPEHDRRRAELICSSHRITPCAWYAEQKGRGK